MAKEVACPTCSFRIRSDSDEELVKHFQQHAKEAHNNNPTRDQVLSMAKTVPQVTV